MDDIRGEAGYVSAQVHVSTPASYQGAGVAGFVQLQTYDFYAKMREMEFLRPRKDTTSPPFRSGTGDSVSRRLMLNIYYKGEDYPPDFSRYEFLLFQVAFGGGTFTDFVLTVESFRQTGDVERALEYAVSGETDGIFYVTGE